MLFPFQLAFTVGSNPSFSAIESRNLLLLSLSAQYPVCTRVGGLIVGSMNSELLAIYLVRLIFTSFDILQFGESIVEN